MMTRQSWSCPHEFSRAWRISLLKRKRPRCDGEPLGMVDAPSRGPSPEHGPGKTPQKRQRAKLGPEGEAGIRQRILRRRGSMSRAGRLPGYLQGPRGEGEPSHLGNWRQFRSCHSILPVAPCYIITPSAQYIFRGLIFLVWITVMKIPYFLDSNCTYPLPRF